MTFIINIMVIARMLTSERILVISNLLSKHMMKTFTKVTVTVM